MGTKEYAPPDSMREIRRNLARCAKCRAWWSVSETSLLERCPCGGELVLEDMAKHLETVPYVPFVPITVVKK